MKTTGRSYFTFFNYFLGTPLHRNVSDAVTVMRVVVGLSGRGRRPSIGRGHKRCAGVTPNSVITIKLQVLINAISIIKAFNR